ncbi:MAG: cupin domain-containing protein [Gemmatimonadetes bacterium]|nr:cupin domain-containing protein [Gemmatimonadota bacterium]
MLQRLGRRLEARALFDAARATVDELAANIPDDALRAAFLTGAAAILPPGAQIAVLDGDPSSAVPFTIRRRFPDGYRIAPHTHPTDEHVTVIQGTFAVGMGERFDAAAMRQLAPGGYVTAPANQAHFAAAQGETIVQIHAIGPFALTYVNPADAPRTATK